jgi:hypothetical protein
MEAGWVPKKLGIFILPYSSETILVFFLDGSVLAIVKLIDKPKLNTRPINKKSLSWAIMYGIVKIWS